MDILNRDIANRNGLGKAILVFSGKKCFKETIDLRTEFANIIGDIIEPSVIIKSEVAAISRWIVMYLFDCISNEKEVNEQDYGLINRLIG